MKKAYLSILISILVLSCSTNKSDKEGLSNAEVQTKQDSLNALSLVGNWNAEWETPPEAYPEVEDMEFYMTGAFSFTKDSLTKTVNGYPGCIFAVDTLSHTQSWAISGDTLFLMNGANSPGMTYRVAAKSEDRIRLQLMEDIFVTLTK